MNNTLQDQMADRFLRHFFIPLACALSLWVGAVSLAGQTQSPEEEMGQLLKKSKSGEKFTAEDHKRRKELMEILKSRGPNREQTSIGRTPLMDLGTGAYQGKQGGLYPYGKNTPPADHLQAGLKLAGEITPLDVNGKPDKTNGWIVMMSVGMSNTQMEFAEFMSEAQKFPQTNPRLKFLNGAQGGMSANVFIDLDKKQEKSGLNYWNTLEARLHSAEISPKQIQVAWMKQAISGPTLPFPGEPESLRKFLKTALHMLKERYPNLKLVYCSERIYGGYSNTPLAPEPHAYETGFGVKWLIEDQIKGDPALNYDPAKGGAKSPWLAWGPSLWADGIKPRSDGLVWKVEDLSPRDGTHPAAGAKKKVATLLMDFFKNDSTSRSWFLKN